MNHHAVTLCITGGHATPAIAVADEVKRRHPDWEIVWIGRHTALEGSRFLSEEFSLVTERDIRFLPLTAGRLTRVWHVQTLVSLAKIPYGFFQAFRYCAREKFDCIVSFGGYIALPVAVAGWLLGIPVITHEQTRIPGFANRIIGFIAQRICINFAESATFFAMRKTVEIGLPLRKKLFHPSKTNSIGVAVNKPVLYVTGGSTGAVSLNELLFSIVGQLTKDWSIIHQTGHVSFDYAIKTKQALPKERQSRYLIKPYVSEDELSWIYAHARMVIARAGANTVGELAALGKVSVLIPLPWSSYQEQQMNAEWLVEAGSAVVLDQKKITPQLFIEIVRQMTKDFDNYQNNADCFSSKIPRDADKRMVKEIEELVVSCTEKLS
ncbi:MAG: UDP-N-acetylglucosamine--N-acetylmuramyl-(pentapeptide) pyrophosphoryl-undecaprenol N-acetylglucosamine transferase [Patescibacteria group bacterium]